MGFLLGHHLLELLIIAIRSVLPDLIPTAERQYKLVLNQSQVFGKGMISAAACESRNHGVPGKPVLPYAPNDLLSYRLPTDPGQLTQGQILFFLLCI